MSDLGELARPLIAHPLVARPDLATLRRRNQRRTRRRRSTMGAALAVVLAATFTASPIDGSGVSDSTKTIARLASYFRASVNIPDATLTAVGVPDSLAVPNLVAPGTATASTDHVVSYVGAEYCPYCAFQRWSLLIALSKFGTFENLSRGVYSSSSDAFPHLASWSYAGSRYSSRYFRFDPTELTSSVANGHGGYQPLQRMSRAQKASYDLYDPRGSLPFIDVGNSVVTVGASASPSVLEGLTLTQIGSAIREPTSRVAKAVDGTANYLIAALCSMVTGSQPHLCDSPVIATARSNIDLGHSSMEGPPALVPRQPALTAPLTTWRRWSDAMHAYLLRTLPSVKRQFARRCTLVTAGLRATVYTKTNLGIPPGVKVWAVSLSGHCGTGVTTSNTP